MKELASSIKCLNLTVFIRLAYYRNTAAAAMVRTLIKFVDLHLHLHSSFLSYIHVSGY